MNRLQVLLSLVKNLAARPHDEGETCREPWELATGKMEQLELEFESVAGGGGVARSGEGFTGQGLIA